MKRLINTLLSFLNPAVLIFVIISFSGLAIAQSATNTEGMVSRVDVKKKELMINRGSDDGVTVNQRWVVIREGEPVYDPATGDLIAMHETEVAEFTITKVAAGSAYGKINKIHKEEVEERPGKFKKVDMEIQTGYPARPAGARSSRFWISTTPASSSTTKTTD